jgi:hypothetical protein
LCLGLPLYLTDKGKILHTAESKIKTIYKCPINHIKPFLEKTLFCKESKSSQSAVLKDKLSSSSAFQVMYTPPIKTVG